MSTGKLRERELISRCARVWLVVVSAVLFLSLGIAFTGTAGSEASGFASQAPLQYGTSPQADSGESIFGQKCQGCHNTIGAGGSVGPDLNDITSRRERDWLIRFITSPDQLIAQGDSVARQLVQQYGMAMPNLGLSEQEAEEVLTYIESRSGAQSVLYQPAEVAGVTAVVAAGDAATGRDIFTGRVPLKNGGAACLSCHNISGIGALGGGTVAADLTKAYSTLGGTGITSILKATPFPIMKEIYGRRPLTDDEVASLAAFLRQTDDIQPPASGQSPLIFIVLGVAGFLLIAIILQIIWRGRLSGVRQSLVKGGS